MFLFCRLVVFDNVLEPSPISKDTVPEVGSSTRF